MAGHEQNPQFPVDQAGIPVAQPVPLAQPVPGQPAGPQPTPVYGTPVCTPPASTPGAPAATGAKRRASATRGEPGAAAGARPAVPAGAQRVPAAARPVPPTAQASPVAARPVPAPAIPVASGLGVPRIRAEHDQEEPAEEVTDRAVRAAPPWLVSGVVHMIVLILMGVLYLAANQENKVRIEAIYAEDEGIQLVEDILQDSAKLDMPDIKDPMLSKDLLQVLDPFAAPPQLDLTLDGMAAISDILAPSIGLALTGREKGAREALLGAYGGNATTEAAVQMGLEWLVKQQNPRTGLWSLKGPYADGGANENELAATAMALLALQGNGNTHKAGKFSRNVDRGIAALVRMQDQDGNMFREGVFNHRLYAQAQATIVLCELYGMTKDPRYRQPAQKALDYASRIQSPQGGWRYMPREDSDTSVTGWFVMAMQSGLMAGLTVQSPTLDAISKYLDSATPDGSFYSYQARGEPTLTMTAEALLCRQYLGWPHDDPRLRIGVDHLLENLIDYNEQDLYYWYYATQVLHHMGGRDWDAWNKVMRQAVPANQVKDGQERGSWDPSNDRWGAHGGRLYATCLSVFLLEVYYRHLPIYKHFNLPASILSSPGGAKE